MKHTLWVTGCLAAFVALAACTEKPQVAGAKVESTPAYAGTGVGPYTAAGWKPGDATSWEEQMRTRTQSGQNEYVRSGGK